MLNPTTTKILKALAVLAIVAASGYLAFGLSHRQGIGELEQEAANRLEIAAAALLAPTDKYGYLPELVAGHPVVIDSLLHKSDPQRIRQANAYLERLNNSAKSAVVYILDHEGLAIASSNWNDPQSFVGDNYAFRPYFQNAVKNGNAVFYGMGTTSMVPGYYISHAIRRENRILGVAVVKIDMGRIDETWSRNKDEVAVTDENGIIFLSSLPDWKYRPMQELSAEALEKLKRTRQYDAVLKSPLEVTVLRRLRHDEQIVGIAQPEEDGNPALETHYFQRSKPLAGSDWTINVLVPMIEIETRAVRIAATTAGALALVALSLMYVRQLIIRAQEREKSRMALEQAHEALEQKHRELQQVSEDLRITSITDPLTGAYNRRFFFESVPKVVSAANRHRFPLTIVTIDVDHFKRINDMYGHPAGDKVLQMLTAICKDSLREADVFARFGGEEFIMALPNTDAEAAKGVAERLRIKVMGQTLEIKGEPLGITISCGVSQYREGEAGVEQALKRADDALYLAKNRGRNKVVVR